MSTFTYNVFSALKSNGVDLDMSSVFLTPGVADPSYQNQSWQMVIQDEGLTLWSGTVNPDGSLDAGNAPPGFSYSGNPTCNGMMNVQVIFNPNPDQPCPCNSSDPTASCDPSPSQCSNPNSSSGQNSCAPGPTTASSVELATGNFVFQKDILSVLGLGSGSWSFDLNYKSNFDINGLLGVGFAYPQFMHLEPVGSGPNIDAGFQYNVQLVTEDLSRTIFVNTSGVYAPMAGSNSQANLVVVNQFTSSEEFILTASNGTVTTFYGFNYYHPSNTDYLDVTNPAPGQVKSIVDRYGNTQTLIWTNTSSYVDEYLHTVYDGVPQMVSVTDAYGRVVNYSYDENNDQLQQITDYLNRQINFQYDVGNRLVAVVTPSILKGVTGNTFPGGTAYVFQYDTGNGNAARQNDLIKIWYPNQTQPYLDTETRTVDVAAVYANATPRYTVAYGQSLSDPNSYGKVLAETLGDPENEIGGTATFAYFTCLADFPTNIIDSENPIVSRTIHTDRNGNVTVYDFNANWSVSRLEVQTNRGKNSLEITPPLPPLDPPTPPPYFLSPNPSPFVTWTQFNAQNQPILIVYPEGNSVAYTYDAGNVTGLTDPYAPRVGLLLSESRYPGNTIGINSRAGSNGQIVLTKQYFYEPIFNQLCAVIEERGNPINGDTYFTPQNGGTTPTDADRSRYATLYTFDYQKDLQTDVINDSFLIDLLGFPLASGPADITALITYVQGQMTAGGIPTALALPFGLGDINGDGTGSGTSGLPKATHLGNQVMITSPSVLLVGGTSQPRIQLFTVNKLGQITTATDPEGNLTITTRYPANDPEGTGQTIASTPLGTQQYGLVREIHQDANPNDVMSLVGASGDLVNFVPGLITRTNTPGVYQDLVTRYEGSSGCATCAYDAMGNVLNQTDPRGFTTTSDRNEMGLVYRITSPAPYSFKIETSYDANRNVIQVDAEDWQVQYNSSDPTAVGYGTFTPSGSGTTAHVPMIPGLGGPLRPGWFSNLMTYDILDNKIEDDIDATGSTPSNLITTYQYDANQNLIQITKPAGNTVEYDYDERNLRIAERFGYVPPATAGDPPVNPGAVTAYSYDGNKNLVNVVAPFNRSGSLDNALKVYIADAFASGSMLTLTGDWTLENTYDGFDRVVQAMDAAGNFDTLTYDPTSNLIEKATTGAYIGATPTNRTTFGHSLADTIMRYDEALRLYEQQKMVFLAGSNTLYSQRTVTHIGGGLAFNSTSNDHTGSTILTVAGVTPSYVLTRNVYDRSGRTAFVLADNTGQTTYAYDGASRQILVTDPMNNTVATQYDGNSNPIQVTRTEVCTITEPTVANEVFVSFTWFDCLNRPVVAGTQGADGNLISNLGLCCPWMGLPSTLFSLMGYDSRGNKTTATDPKLNVIVSLYDGASRLIETQQEMRQNGDGRNAPAANQTFLPPNGGVIRTEYVYDGNNRLVELVDDRRSSTLYTYDSLDRLITKTLADGSISTRQYDPASDLTQYIDENGSVLVLAYDALGRKLFTTITAATGVGGTTLQSFQYDGLSRLTQATDLIGSAFATATFTYDSLGRVLEERNNIGNSYPQTWCTTHMTFQSYPATLVAYPYTTINPIIDITVTNTYDLLYRRNSLSGASPTYGTFDSVAWQFFGPNRIVETNYGSNSLIATQMNNARTNSSVQATVSLPGWGNISSDQLGYDGTGRMITKRYLTGGINGTTNAYNDTTSLVGFTTSFDRASNKLYERQLHCEERSSLYQPFNSDGSFAVGYDSANRLRQYQRGVLSSATIPYLVNAGASITTPITLPGADQVKTYGLDGLGNWKTSNFTSVGSGGTTTSTVEVRQHNYVNEITSVQDTTGGTPTTTAFAYDHGNNASSTNPNVQRQGNGNLVNDGVRVYQYDAFNRLIQISNTSGTVIATYLYDALNRRIQKTIANLGGTGFGGLTGDIPAGTTDYLYDGNQIIEERNNATPEVLGQAYFWGQYIDELMFLTNSSGTAYRVLSDILYRSVAMVTTSNVITEAYDTDAYGNPLCYSGPGTDDLWFTDDDVRTDNPINCTIFTGRQYDPESQIYYYRARYYSPTIGRFISRDPLGSPLMMEDATEPSGSAELTQGPNLYWYVQDNAVNKMDPFGRACCDVEAAAAAQAYQTYQTDLALFNAAQATFSSAATSALTSATAASAAVVAATAACVRAVTPAAAVACIVATIAATAATAAAVIYTDRLTVAAAALKTAGNNLSAASASYDSASDAYFECLAEYYGM